jgi:SSS family solute:Na+ symporter
MLSTSASKDLYKRFLNPAADDRQLLRVGRLAAVAGGAAGIVLSVWLDTVITALTIFYSMLVVTLFVPVVGGLYVTRARERDALAAVAAGVLTLLGLRIGSTTALPIDPVLGGIAAGAVTFAGMMILRTRPR